MATASEQPPMAQAEPAAQGINQFISKEDLELQEIIRAYHHAETYNNLIRSVDPRYLKLTLIDEEIYNEFKNLYPHLQLEILNLTEVITPAAKKKWRGFCDKFKDKVDGSDKETLVTIKCREEFTEDNSTFVNRIQFLAIEIARIKDGCYNGLNKNFIP